MCTFRFIHFAYKAGYNPRPRYKPSLKKSYHSEYFSPLYSYINHVAVWEILDALFLYIYVEVKQLKFSVQLA